MFGMAFYITIGLFLGWFFLPQPKWAETVLNFVLSKVPFLTRFVRKD